MLQTPSTFQMAFTIGIFAVCLVLVEMTILALAVTIAIATSPRPK